jgi:PAS domain S-box-containing protein
MKSKKRIPPSTDFADSNWDDSPAQKRTSRIGGFFVAMGALLLLSICLIYWMQRLTDDKRAEVAARRDTVGRLNILFSTLNDAETGQRGYLLTLNPSYLRPFDSAQARIKKDLQQLAVGLDATQKAAPDFSHLLNLIPQKLNELTQTVDLASQGKIDEALSIVRANEGKNLMDQIRLSFANIKEDEDRAVSRAERSVHRTDIERDILSCALVIANLAFLVWAYNRIQRDEQARDEAITDSERQRELLKVTMFSMGDGLIVTDLEGRIMLMNRVSEELTGWTLAQAKGRPCHIVFRIINEETRLTVESPVTKVLREGVVVGLANHTLLIQRDGKEIPIDDSGAPIRESNGNLRGVVLIFRDFSEHRAAEKNLRRAADGLALANSAKDAFLARLSHELRNPLGAILGWIGLMMDSTQGQNIQSQGLEVVHRNAIILSKLVSDLLDVSRITTGTMSLEFGEVDLSLLINAAIQTFVPEGNDKKVMLVSVLDKKEGIIVSGDSVRLSEVLTNLISNALKFTPEGGVITISLREENQTAIIEVEDTGIGIAPDFLDRIFEPFTQDKTAPGWIRGMGLGLSITKSLVELHHGTIQAESKGSGFGSKFTVRLPLKRVDNLAMREAVRNVREVAN